MHANVHARMQMHTCTHACIRTDSRAQASNLSQARASHPPLAQPTISPPKYNGDLAETRRTRNLTKKHSIREKMELYTSSTKGKLEDLKDALCKEYSITEEISKCGYYWTILHYASHYGHYDILIYLIEILDDHPNKYEIYNM